MCVAACFNDDNDQNGLQFDTKDEDGRWKANRTKSNSSKLFPAIAKILLLLLQKNSLDPIC